MLATRHRVIWVRVLAGNFVLYSLARHLTLTVPILASPRSTVMGELVTSNFGNWDKLRPDGSNVDRFFTFFSILTDFSFLTEFTRHFAASYWRVSGCLWAGNRKRRYHYSRGILCPEKHSDGGHERIFWERRKAPRWVPENHVWKVNSKLLVLFIRLAWSWTTSRVRDKIISIECVGSRPSIGLCTVNLCREYNYSLPYVNWEQLVRRL